MADGLDAVEDALRAALEADAASDDVILNILARRREKRLGKSALRENLAVNRS
jgi:hypothetical protein